VVIADLDFPLIDRRKLVMDSRRARWWYQS